MGMFIDFVPEQGTEDMVRARAQTESARYTTHAGLLGYDTAIAPASAPVPDVFKVGAKTEFCAA